MSKFRDADELTPDIGSQLCALIAEHEKQLLQQNLLVTSKYRIEYFNAKKEKRLREIAELEEKKLSKPEVSLT